jgi:hypothetical protein
MTSSDMLSTFFLKVRIEIQQELKNIDREYHTPSQDLSNSSEIQSNLHSMYVKCGRQQRKY